MAMVLIHLGIVTEAEQQTLAGILFPPIGNRAGLEVGCVRRAAESPF
jgi:hypothetical protein